MQYYLNLDRVLNRQALAVALGLEAGRSPAGVAELAAGAADDPNAARAVRLRAAVEAETARVKARMRR